MSKNLLSPKNAKSGVHVDCVFEKLVRVIENLIADWESR